MNLPKAFPMPTLATIDISGMKIMPVYSCEIISVKVTVLLTFSTENGGGAISGNPSGTLPKLKRCCRFKWETSKYNIQNNIKVINVPKCTLSNLFVKWNEMK